MMESELKPRVYTLLVLLLVLVVAAVVLVMEGRSSSDGEALPAVNRIAYVTLERQIRTVQPDGSDAVTISLEDGSFAWPTWSPDGRTLVFSGVVSGGPGEPRIGLYSYEADSGQLSELHVRQSGPNSLVAHNAPHYAFWSPNGEHLAFIGGMAGDLRLYLDDKEDAVGPRPTMDGGPMWFDWSADSRYLLVHQGVDHFLITAEDGTTRRLAIPYDGPGYNVPAWRRSDSAMTFVSGRISEGYSLYTSGREAGSEPQPLTEVSGNTAFLWSPDSSALAITRGRPRRAFYSPVVLRVYDGVRLFSPDRSAYTVEIEEPTIAFFWSPDSTKLAYLTLTEAPGVLRWNILNGADGSRWPLADFLPSADQLVMVQFFDQYAHSHSVWSPDSQSLVIAGRTATGAVSAASRQPADQIIVLTTDPTNPTFQVIGDGYLGFWSPR